MSAITLYLPGLLGPWPTIYRPQLKSYLNDHPETAAALQQLLSGKSASPSEGLHASLYQQLTPGAAHSYAQDRWRSESAYQADQPLPTFCADPVSMQAEMHGARVFDSALLDISDDDARQLSDDFNALFSDDGYRWQLIENRGYLFVDDPVDVQTLPLNDATEVDLLEWGFTGKDSSRFQKFATEWQMWLHQQPINTHRRATKQLPISALWLWGEGDSRVQNTAYRALYQNQADRLTSGLCNRLGLPQQPLTATVASNAPPSSIVIDDRLFDSCNALEWEAWLSELDHVCDTLIAPVNQRIGNSVTTIVPGVTRFMPISGVARLTQWFSRTNNPPKDFVEAVQWR